MKIFQKIVTKTIGLENMEKITKIMSFNNGSLSFFIERQGS